MSKTLSTTEPRSIPDKLAFTFNGLRDTGILWAINRVLFHPRGFALALAYAPEDLDDTGEPVGWNLYSAESGQVYEFENGTEDSNFKKFEAFLESIRYHDELKRQE